MLLCDVCVTPRVCARTSPHVERAQERSGKQRREDWVGGGPRTKETNLNGMTCYAGVKWRELGFGVPSPRRHIHLTRLDLLVDARERLNVMR